MMDILERELEAAYGTYLNRRSQRRRAGRIAAVAATALLATAGAAFGAAALLGVPAPWHVKQEIAAVDRGMPADLRLNPDVEHAVAVAATDRATPTAMVRATDQARAGIVRHGAVTAPVVDIANEAWTCAGRPRTLLTGPSGGPGPRGTPSAATTSRRDERRPAGRPPARA
jgi:hypothetical protein